jgi:hypothetical protein
LNVSIKIPDSLIQLLILSPQRIHLRFDLGNILFLYPQSSKIVCQHIQLFPDRSMISRRVISLLELSCEGLTCVALDLPDYRLEELIVRRWRSSSGGSAEALGC